MALHDLRHPFKRAADSDQQLRREMALHRQFQYHSNAHRRARLPTSSHLSLLTAKVVEPHQALSIDVQIQAEVLKYEAPVAFGDDDEFRFLHAARVKGGSRQLMLPEWLIDVPPHLDGDWNVIPRPAGK